ncbi:MAG: Hint domain-containing protein [Paracoccus sp. (in: a-proteobacteria)]
MANYIGTAGNDTYGGTTLADSISGLGGNDSLGGSDGNDTILGGDGDDSITGGAGIDSITGDAGIDTIDGGSENDVIDGGSGNDVLYGAAGDDNILGSGGDDVIYGDVQAPQVNPLSETTGWTYSPSGGIYNPTFNSSQNTHWLWTDGADSAPGTATHPLTGTTWTTGTSYNVQLNASTQYHSGEAGVNPARGNDLFTVSVKVDGVVVATASAHTGSLTNIMTHYNLTLTPTGNTPLNPNLTPELVITEYKTQASWDSVLSNNLDFSGVVVTSAPGTGSAPSTIAGNDTLDGGIGNDTIFGNAGADILAGAAGNDSLDGGIGDDSISGGADNDSILGDDGTDTLLGNDGADTISGGAGTDLIYGDSTLASAGDGNDVLTGDAGNDTIFGGAGNDSVDGGADNDIIDGGAGTDTLLGGDGADTILGGLGTDSIAGGTGNDSVEGGADNDTIDGGDGNDILLGGAGNDSVAGGIGDDNIQGGDGTDTVVGGDGADLLYGDSSLASAGDASDMILGDAGNDTIYGGVGNDTIDGGADNDSIFGGEDSDSLTGGDGADTVDGGDGNDILLGGAGTDSLTGGAGNDSIDGGLGADTQTGGAGNDTFIAGSGDLVTDFNAGNTGGIHDGDLTNNDVLDLSGYYNATTLAAWNAANPGQTYRTPLEWLKADQGDGVLNMLDGSGSLPTFTMTLQNGGAAVTASQLSNENTLVVCFAAGTLILTQQGERPVEDLAPGDLVQTRDHGLQPIRWAGKRVLSPAELAANPKLRPIRIRKGALGRGLPAADLVVSPQHRVLVRSRIAQRMFGADEVLVAAKQLCQIDGIEVAEDMASVAYHHIMFDRHEVVISNGAETESLFTGPEALKAVGAVALTEILTLFPELANENHRPEAARTIAIGRRARQMAERHARHAMTLQ